MEFQHKIQDVQPIHHPILSDFCTKLTGITQDVVSSADTFDEVFSQFRVWIENEQGLVGSEEDSTKTKLAFLTCGDWDLRHMLPEQCRTSQLPIPGYMKRWINIKQSFAASFGQTDFLKVFPQCYISLIWNLEDGLIVE